MTSEKLTEQQQTMARLLATSDMDKSKIADVVGISRTTLYHWEKKPEMIAEIDRIKSEFQNFGRQLMENKLIDAVNGYWNLIHKTDNAMVAKSGYEYFIDRSLGKVTSKHELTTKIDDSFNVDQNEIKEVFDSIDELDEGEDEE